jgi:hypothetical protein
VLLIDQYRSYIDNNFIIKATASNIYLFPFPGHLIYILQPLNIGIFQPYKYWYKKAVQYTIYNLDIDYNIASFLRDLGKICNNIFKRGTILEAFRKAGI